MIGLFLLKLQVVLEVAKREEKSTFCARFVHDRRAALVIRHDLSGDTDTVLAYGRTWDRKLPFSPLHIGTFE